MPWSSSDRLARLPKGWHKTQERVLADNERDNNGECQIKWDPSCTREATEVDHIIPGDDHRRENLRAGCDYCHARKSSSEGNAAKARMRALRKRPTERHPGRV